MTITTFSSFSYTCKDSERERGLRSPLYVYPMKGNGVSGYPSLYTRVHLRSCVSLNTSLSSSTRNPLHLENITHPSYRWEVRPSSVGKIKDSENYTLFVVVRCMYFLKESCEWNLVNRFIFVL